MYIVSLSDGGAAATAGVLAITGNWAPLRSCAEAQGAACSLCASSATARGRFFAPSDHSGATPADSGGGMWESPPRTAPHADGHALPGALSGGRNKKAHRTEWAGADQDQQGDNWMRRQDSNLRPPAYEAGELPTAPRHWKRKSPSCPAEAWSWHREPLHPVRLWDFHPLWRQDVHLLHLSLALARLL